MENTVKVAISSDFLTAFAALPRKIQGKVTEFINKFRNNPKSPGINYEKLKDAADNKICSVRIDDTYRGIVAREDQTGVYLLLWVDHHDEAYDWARRKKCEVNPKSGAIQVFEIQDSPETGPQVAVPSLFGAFLDEDLLSIGVPQELLTFVKSIPSAEAFYDASTRLPKDAFEYLSWLAEGLPFAEVLDLVESEREKDGIGDTLAEALESSQSLKSFVVIEGEEELHRIMSEPLEKWRVFLHPTQRKIVHRNYSGPTRVLGGAGTGKTVVAMHRAKQLATGLKERERILFTTYTANLAADIRENLRKICTVEELRHIEVINLDAWVSRFLREQGYSAKIIYDTETAKLWEEAYSEADGDLGLPISFYEEEWNRVVVAQTTFSLEKYIKAVRNGRGTRLDRKKRMQVWKVFEAYQNLMKEQQVRDINMAMAECCTLVAKLPYESKYKHIIVDESQDLSTNAFRLLRDLAGEEHANDMFIVGDSHQRIYKNRAVLSKCGINIRGRSSILKINYRTTEEVRRYAFALLNGVSFDDLDDSVDLGDTCQSLTHGQAPQISFFNDASEEFDYILNEIKKLNANGVALNNICVVARTHKLLEDYLALFTKNGVRSYEIRSNKTDDRSYDGLRIATMHRVKG